MKRITCVFDICIYNEQDLCLLDSIEISGAGHCGSCVIADIPETVLAAGKRRLLKRYGRIDKIGYNKKKY